MNGDVSIFDVPKLYGPSLVKSYKDTEIIPLSTFCELDTESSFLSMNAQAMDFGWTPNCTNFWNTYIQDSDNPANKNPNLIPKNDPFGLCGKQITDKAK